MHLLYYSIYAPLGKWFYQLGTGDHTERVHRQSSITMKKQRSTIGV